MYNFRYYAIGHSYLKHGPFQGWQTEGFWGMAASRPETDYFHKFQDYLKTAFECKIEAIAENHATYERRCVEGVTEKEYKESPDYLHMKEVISEFKPNIISVFVGGGNTIANDEKSLSLFFDVLYRMIKENKQEECVVLCMAHNLTTFEICKPIAQRYGFIPCDVTFIHDIQGRDNPYYAYRDYPEYDEQAARGAVEFRTHPNDKGHDAIAKQMLDCAKASIVENISEGDYAGAYKYSEFISSDIPERLAVLTEPEINISYSGFNIRQTGKCVSFSSAPGTGASFAAEKLDISCEKTVLRTEVCVEGDEKNRKMKLWLASTEAEYTYYLDVHYNEMHSYEFDISDVKGNVTAFRISPEMDECMITLKSVTFR